MINPQKIRVPALQHHKATGQAKARWEGRDFYFGKHGSPKATLAYRRWVGALIAEGKAVRVNSRHDDEAVTVAQITGLFEQEWRRPGAPSRPRSSRPCNGSSGLWLHPRGGIRSPQPGGVPRTPRRAGATRWEGDSPAATSTAPPALSGEFSSSRHESGSSSPLSGRRCCPSSGSSPATPTPRRPSPSLPSPTPSRGNVAALTPDRRRHGRLSPRHGVPPRRSVRVDVDPDTDRGRCLDRHPQQAQTKHKEKARTIAIGPRAQRVLLKYRDRPPEAAIFSARAGETARKARACASRGQRPSLPPRASGTPGPPPIPVPSPIATPRASTPKPSAAACERAGVPHWSPNQLRPPATEIRDSHGIESAAVTLGHSEALLTARVYAERNQQRAVAVARDTG